MNPLWYENFFEGITLDFWRKAVPPEQTEREVDFFVRTLSLHPGARVLDVPCGLGRHSIALASRGLRVTGVDQSRGGIEECRERAAALQLAVEWRRTDMRVLPWQAEFDAVVCFGNSFGYLDAAGMRAFVQAASRTLKLGGRFLLDTGMTAESVLPNLRDREWAPVDDMLFLEENRYHIAEGCYETVYTFVRGGETETRSGFHWVFTVREIRSMLAEAGLTVTEMYRSLDCEPFQVGSRYLVLLAEKR